ncbi:MAG: DNA polymerase/3'-5' exonuclease PolX [Bacteroidetes bacterium]|nr:DNA polymerase/3'-5' exonuclease PolX [Bacteroidota bacterium]
MTNKEISNQFSMLSKLMEVHGENSFRSKSYSIAAYKISQLPEELQSLSEEKISSLNGIGDAIAKKIQEIFSDGMIKNLQELISKTPEGIFEMLKIKGLGPKKIGLIWKEMGIENIGELLYACEENRLLLYEGFGKKTQQNVMEAIQFFMSQKGNYLYAQLDQLSKECLMLFKRIFSTELISATGDFRRQEETMNALEFVLTAPLQAIISEIKNLNNFAFHEQADDWVSFKFKDGIIIKIYSTDSENFITTLFDKTGTEEFVNAFGGLYPKSIMKGAENEDQLFTKAGIQFIPPFLRDNTEIIETAAKYKIPQVIQPKDIKGIIHCHSNWSDGINTLEDLANACRKSGKEYLVISDHSKSAFYANGLSIERIKAQHELVDELNKKLNPFKIFKSIESDILNDGSLDYGEEVLQSFDLVIASVHSNLKMTEEKATTRLLKAIENPFTTILGHMTGRLLLSRKGYPLDYKKIIDACAANNVVIEINANPRRLDMSWQWIPYALSKNVLLSINPDSHSIPEFENTDYGVLAAQKGMLTSAKNLSSFSLPDLESFLKNKKLVQAPL